jgi:hypothetical protein
MCSDRDSLVTAVRQLSVQTIPQKLDTEVAVEYATLLYKFRQQRANLLRCIRSEEHLWNTIERTRLQDIQKKPKARAHFNYLSQKHNIEWHDLDGAFGFDWIKPTFLKYLREYFKQGIRFDAIVRQVTKQGQESSNLKPKDVQQALQDYIASKNQAARQSGITHDFEASTEEEDAYEADDDLDPQPAKRIRYSVDIEHPRAQNHQLDDDTVSLGYQSGPRLSPSSPLTRTDDSQEDLAFFTDIEAPETALGTHHDDCELSVIETQGDSSSHLSSIMGPLDQALDEALLDQILENAINFRHCLQQTNKSWEDATASVSTARKEAEAADTKREETRKSYNLLMCQDTEKDKLAAQLELVQDARLRVETAKKLVVAAQLQETEARERADRVKDLWEKVSLVFFCPNASGSSQGGS